MNYSKFVPAQMFAKKAKGNPNQFFVVHEVHEFHESFRIQDRNSGVRVCFTYHNIDEEFTDEEFAFEEEDSVSYKNDHCEHTMAFQMVDQETMRELHQICLGIMENKRIQDSIEHDAALLKQFMNLGE